jgi:MFS superfamily sulfate permease-like transporter
LQQSSSLQRCISLFVGVDIGIGVATGLSLLFVLYETAYPHTAVLGRLSESSVYRNVKQYPDAQEFDGIVIMRFDAPLYFANSEYTREVSRILHSTVVNNYCFSRLPKILLTYLILTSVYANK